jgi:acetoacetyl-CoA synthetase
MTVPLSPKDDGPNGANSAPSLPKLLWEHTNPKSTPMWAFLQHVNEKYGLQAQTYKELLRWSIENIADFWGEVWEFVGVRVSAKYTAVSIDCYSLCI